MPLGMGITVHDDSKHTGNAKRGIANGLAGLNSNIELEDVDIMTQKYLSIGMVI